MSAASPERATLDLARWAHLRRLAPQPLLGIAVAAAALVVSAGIWLTIPPAVPDGPHIALLVLLAASITISRRYPLLVGARTRICVASVPIYLLAFMFPAPLAVLGVVVGMTAGELVICKQCGNTVGDILAQVGRWALVMAAVSSLVHLPSTADLGFTGALGAILLWGGDVVTSPVAFSPITGEDALTAMLSAARRSWPAEPMQYLIAMLGLVTVTSAIDPVSAVWTGVAGTLMILLPVVLLYLYLKNEDSLRGAIIGDASE